jgi:hypothetical protein
MIVNSGKQRRLLVDRAQRCLGASVQSDWNWRQGPIGPIDLVPFVSGQSFRHVMNQDFRCDRAGYRKIGGSANTPESAYFYRRYANLVHLLRRQERFHLRGSLMPEPGMVLILDWPGARGRFNFSPDRMGVIIEVSDSLLRAAIPMRKAQGWVISELSISADSPVDRSLIAYADPPL